MTRALLTHPASIGRRPRRVSRWGTGVAWAYPVAAAMCGLVAWGAEGGNAPDAAVTDLRDWAKALRDWLTGSLPPGLAPWLLGAAALLVLLFAFWVGRKQGWRRRHAIAIRTEERLRRELSLERGAELGSLKAKTTGEPDDGPPSRVPAQSGGQPRRDMLSAIAHGLRTPLAGTLGYCEMLLDTPLNPEQRQIALTVRQSADMLLVRLSDLIDFSRMEEGRLTLSVLPFDLRDTVVEVLELLSAQANEKGLDLAYDAPETRVVQVEADAVRARQVLMNLVGNAIKFTARGHVLVRLESQSGGPKVLAKCTVTDTGVGVPREAQARLFQPPPASADPADASMAPEPGLGLVIARRLVEQMGGTMGMSSQAGIGSNFWFTLPAAKESDVPETMKVSSNAQGLRALLFEPSAVGRQMVAAHLAAGGMIAESVSTSLAAMERVRSQEPGRMPVHVVVFAESLGDMTSHRFAEGIRQDPALARVALVCLRRPGSHGQSTVLSSLGVTEVLKPVLRLGPLLAAVMEAVAAREAAIAAGQSTAKAAEVPRQEIVPPKGFVLVAEDNEINQRLLRDMLRRLGWACEVVANGDEAVRAVERKDYALVLMDCYMPEVDGFLATQRIRAWEERHHNPRVPIVAVTADAQSGNRERCFKAGMDDFIAKPVRRGDLEDVLRRRARPGPARAP